MSVCPDFRLASHLHESGGQVPSATVCATKLASGTSQNKRKSSDGSLSDGDDGGSHPSKRAKQTSIAARLALSSYSTTAPLSTPYLSLLPAELVDRICTHLPDHVDVALFALTSRRHWQIGRRHIRSRIEVLCNWAGDRLICLGSYAEDLPPGLLTAAEEKELETGYTSADELIDESVDDDDEDEDGEIREDGESQEDSESHEDNAKTTRISLYEVARRRFTEQVNTDLYVKVNKRLLDYHAKGHNDCDLLVSLLYPEYAHTRHGVQWRTLGPEAVGLRQVYWQVQLRWPQAEHAEQWAVLRNLSRREYVHGKALQELRDRDHGHEDEWAVSNIMSFGFGEVLGLRSFWSETEQGSDYDWDYCHGVWAGHRFDIVLEQDHEKAMEREEWTDVSEEALAEMVKVCQKEFD